FEFKEQPAAKNPSVFVDTTQIKMGMGEDIVSTDLESKQITGILLPNNKNNLIVPAKHVEKINTTTQEQANSNTAMNVGEAPVKPTNIDLRQVSGDYLSTYSLPPIEEKNNITSTSNNNSNYVDPFANYTIPNAKANYKSQYLTQGITLPKTIVEPLSPDSIQRKFVEDSLYHLRVYDSIRNANEQQQANNAAQQNMYQLNNPNTYQQPSNYNYVNNADATQNTVYHFYLTQTGHYSVSFSNNYFYLNVDERGVVKDYGLINNGYITKGIPDGKPIHVGNLYVGYNNSNKINNIAGVEVSYAFDGRINKVGNTYINYNYEGVMEKIGNVNITYNSNFTVYRFGPFGVNYDNYGNVLGVDENRGLIIFNK
ncbi:MAG: hypothetical protein JSR09_09835, partial [Bacteroidetes bacterium]|nr:hypothetical protein [Bacteroidota bacterium]